MNEANTISLCGRIEIDLTKGELSLHVALNEKQTKAIAESVKTPKPKAKAKEPQAWSLALAGEVEKHVRDNFGLSPSKAQIRSWALRAEQVVRSDQFVPALSPEELVAIYRWGMADSFWGQNIQSIKPAQKMRSLVAKYRTRQRPQGNVETYQPMDDDAAFASRGAEGKNHV